MNAPQALRQLFWAMPLLLLLAYAGCKPKKEIADRYKYLIKENKTETDSAVVETPTPLPPTSISGKVSRALAEADSYLGTPYRHGGISKNGIDCSGLAHKSYLAAGVELPRSTGDQALIGTLVNRADLIPGDLVFFSNKADGHIDHVGIIYKVEGPAVTFIHASTSKGVRYDRLDEGYWKDLYVTGRRVAGK